MATRKRKLNLPSLDGDGTDPPRIRDINVGVETLPHNKYRVAYTVMSKLMQSTLDWNDTCAIARCVSCEHETTNLYSFRKQSCHKQRGSGVESLRIIKNQRNKIAANLTHGDWMMFESPEPNVQPFWIGRAVSKSEWNNSCFYKNNTTRWKNLMGNLPLDPGKYAVNIKWYNQRDIGSSLEYTVDRTNPYPIVNHHHTLVLGGFDMVQIVGNAVRVPRQRTIQSWNEFGYNISQQNLQTREGDWYRREFENVYRLSEEVRDRGIARCGQWAGQ
jgi:hypothetical protein